MPKGCAKLLLAVFICIFAIGVWINFALAYERTRSRSPDGNWIVTAFIDGTPLTRENERVHIWRSWLPHFRWLGCEILEAKNEAPIRLTWPNSTTLLVEHGFQPGDILRTQGSCRNLRVVFKRSFKPYS
jgi:hypothetical protein